MDPTRDPIPCTPAAPYRHAVARLGDEGLSPATVDREVAEYSFE